MKALTNIICLARRSFPLGSIFILIALTSCCMMQPGTAIVFTTLAPDCTYDANVASFPDISQGSGPQPQHPSTTSKMAMFTSMTSGNLAKVYLGLTNADTPYNRQLGPLSVDVFLCDDAPYHMPLPTGGYGDWVHGGPDIATQTYLGRVAPTKFLRQLTTV